MVKRWLAMRHPAGRCSGPLRAITAMGIVDVSGGSPTEAVYVDGAGSVGIGSASLATKLDVNGVITAISGNSGQWNTA